MSDTDQIVIIDDEIPAPKTTRRRAQKPQAQVASESPPEEPEVQITFTAAECSYLYSLLGIFESVLARAITKCPAEIAAKAFSYSPQDCEILAEPTAKVLTKYGGPWLGHHKDEMLLLVVLAKIHHEKLTIFNQALSEWKQAEETKKKRLVSIHGGTEAYSDTGAAAAG